MIFIGADLDSLVAIFISTHVVGQRLWDFFRMIANIVWRRDCKGLLDLDVVKDNHNYKL